MAQKASRPSCSPSRLHFSSFLLSRWTFTRSFSPGCHSNELGWRQEVAVYCMLACSAVSEAYRHCLPTIYRDPVSRWFYRQATPRIGFDILLTGQTSLFSPLWCLFFYPRLWCYSLSWTFFPFTPFWYHAVRIWKKKGSTGAEREKCVKILEQLKKRLHLGSLCSGPHRGASDTKPTCCGDVEL